jgi:toxin-antitoxin system PIN domain toxin
VILVDVNLLLYATFENTGPHATARVWLEERLNDIERVGLPWHCLLGFLRISTNPRSTTGAISMHQAWELVQCWLDCECVWIPQPTQRHADVLGSLLAQPGIRGDLTSDAHLAALAIEHGLTLYSTDGDFARFRELKWINPLAP